MAKRKKKSSIGCLFWVAFVLLIIVIFLFSRTGVDRLLTLTGLHEVIDSEEETSPEVRRITPETDDETPIEIKTEPKDDFTTKKQPTDDYKDELQLPDIILEVPETEPEPKPEKPLDTRMVFLYFVKVHDDGTFTLERVTRRGAITQTPLTGTLEILLQGTTTDEINQGLVTFISENTRINRVYIQDNIAFIDFSEEIRFNTFGREGLKAELKQIIYTATEFTTVDKVQILINGEKRDYLASEGIYIGTPLSRNSFS